jgi:hypothetical protein
MAISPQSEPTILPDTRDVKPCGLLERVGTGL